MVEVEVEVECKNKKTLLCLSSFLGGSTEDILRFLNNTKEQWINR